MNEELRVGRHVLRYEPPDTMGVKFTGPITASDLRELSASCKSWAAGHRYLLFLVDLSDSGRATPDARRASRDRVEYEMRGIAIFGASERIRIVANLVVSATNILLRRIDNPLRFFSTELQAREWLSERRKILAERGGAV